MPKAYEAIRDKAVEQGMDYDAAQTKAAKIYNWMRKTHPNMQPLEHTSKKTKLRVKKPKY